MSNREAEEAVRGADGPAAARRGRAVLVVSYYFPPAGGPGVQRVLKFVALPARRCGYPPGGPHRPGDRRLPAARPVAWPRRSLARRGSCAARSASSTALPRGGRAAPPGDREPRHHRARGEGLRGRAPALAARRVFIPDGRMGWLPGGTRAGLRAIREERVELIFASGPPFTAHWIAPAARRPNRPPPGPRLSRPLDARAVLPAPSRPQRAGCDERLERVVPAARRRRAHGEPRHPRRPPPPVPGPRSRPGSSGAQRLRPGRLRGAIVRTRGRSGRSRTPGTLPGGRFPGGFTGALRRVLAGRPRGGRAAADPDDRARRDAGARSAASREPPLDRVVRFEGYRPHARVGAGPAREPPAPALHRGGTARAPASSPGSSSSTSGRACRFSRSLPKGRRPSSCARTRSGRVVRGEDAERRWRRPARGGGGLPRGEARLRRAGRRDWSRQYSRPELTARLAARFSTRCSREPDSCRGRGTRIAPRLRAIGIRRRGGGTGRAVRAGRRSMQIPLVDLKAQYARIHAEIDAGDPRDGRDDRLHRRPPGRGASSAEFAALPRGAPTRSASPPAPPPSIWP